MALLLVVAPVTASIPSTGAALPVNWPRKSSLLTMARKALSFSLSLSPRVTAFTVPSSFSATVTGKEPVRPFADTVMPSAAGAASAGADVSAAGASVAGASVTAGASAAGTSVAAGASVSSGASAVSGCSAGAAAAPDSFSAPLLIAFTIAVLVMVAPASTSTSATASGGVRPTKAWATSGSSALAPMPSVSANSSSPMESFAIFPSSSSVSTTATRPPKPCSDTLTEGVPAASFTIWAALLTASTRAVLVIVAPARMSTSAMASGGVRPTRAWATSGSRALAPMPSVSANSSSPMVISLILS